MQFVSCFIFLLSFILCSIVLCEYNCEYKKDGFYSDPDFCHIYWRCNYGVAEEYECPAGTAWNHVESRCDWLDNVDCNRVDDSEDKPEDKEDIDEPKEDEEQEEQEEVTKKRKTTKKSKTTTEEIIEQTNILDTLTNADGDFDTKAPSDKPAASSVCSMPGTYLLPDSANCASYFSCNDGKENKLSCPDKQLFNIDTSSCEEFQKVFCGTRAVNLAEKNQCQSKRDGIYPDIDRSCRVFYQCTNQQKIREANCPNNLKFNSLTGRCDNPANIVPPCGTYSSTSGTSLLKATNGIFFSFILYNIVKLF